MKIISFKKNLLRWYQKNKRDLPFRSTKNPYKIWLSEIMLQQTTMVTVIDYYQRFIKKYPNLESVAAAPEQDLLKTWQGLGYYSRIRNFQTACQQVQNDFDGKIPRKFSDLKKLKGIGDYTAAAISSICFDEPNAVVDGNVKRVLSRVLRFTDDVSGTAAKKYFDTEANKLLDTKNPGDFNQAMMELGATVCLPSNPKCLLCPVNSWCLSAGKSPMDIPKKKKMTYIATRYAALVLHSSQKILLKTPSSHSLIANMWELPSHYDQKKLPTHTWKQNFSRHFDVTKLKKTGEIKHAITNKKISIEIYSHAVPLSQLTKFERDGFKFFDFYEIENIPLNTLSKKVLKSCLKNHTL